MHFDVCCSQKRCQIAVKSQRLLVLIYLVIDYIPLLVVDKGLNILELPYKLGDHVNGP